MAKFGERFRPIAACFVCCAVVVCAAACGNDAQSNTSGGSGGTSPTGTAGSASTGARAGAAGTGALASAAGGSTASGGSPGVAAGGKPNGYAGTGSISLGGTGSGSAGTSSTPGGSSSMGNAGQGGDTPRSCATSGPGRTTCGTNGDESCCTSLPVTGGMYSRTYTNSGSGATGKADPATISTFRLDKYETTVARFREYVKYLESGGSPPAPASGKHKHLNQGQGLADSGKSGSFEPGWDAKWNSKIPSGAGATAKWKANLTASNGTAGCKVYGTWTNDPGKNDLLPITCTSWYESYAFCIWDGGFLPSEAEWKYAAAGGDEQREYPWGTTAPGTNNEYAIYDCCYPSGKCSATSGSDTCTGLVNVAPVGSTKKGLGKYGQFDLIGSVWEWNLDKFENSYANPCTDCAYLTGSTTNRVLPGAGFHTGASLGSTLMYSYNRASISYDADTYRGDYAVGLRCARSP